MSDGKAKVEAMRDNKIVLVEPEDLTTEELCEALEWLHLDKSELYEDEVPGEQAAVNEAVKRLQKLEVKNAELEEQVCDLLDEVPEKAPRRAVGGC